MHGVNNEIPIMEEIIRSLHKGASEPTLVRFFTDCEFHEKMKVTTLMGQVADLLAFWQFVGVGVGKANYGVIEKLDTMFCRTVDNAGFFAVDSVDTVRDGELYERLLGGYPDWLKAARTAHVLSWAISWWKALLVQARRSLTPRWLGVDRARVGRCNGGDRILL
ncbi:VWA domain-containing protein [Rhodococcus globerulus]|uniref:VWA domain-containing protein n=1 Tax=Rhodococcus globerulus TaxID=33008 RepID=A0ABU4C2B2_RHOGO|nr:VWA domain-containing protein [Rhodococcus globerulus]MDV6270617.1 VWA domain-containing protein [Rhodococcus globerulus]